MATTQWNIDPSHSQIQFKVKHLMITTVTGSFNAFDATVTTEGDDFTNANISFTAQTNSIDTGSEQRDTHLKSADFFDAENFPTLTFTSTGMEKKDSENFVLHGNMTIKDVTKPVTLDVEFGGLQKDPWGNAKAGFTLSGKVNRKEWNLNWNVALESGGLLVADEVRIICEVQVAQVEPASVL